MGDSRISDLTAETTLANTDLVPVVDVANEATKQITVQSLLGGTMKASFTVFVDGDNYKAVDVNGDLVSTDTDAAIVIQYALDNLPVTGGMVYIRAGTYELETTRQNSPSVTYNCLWLGSTTGTTNNNVHLRGEGIGTTILKYTGPIKASSIIATCPAGNAPTDYSVSNLTTDCNGLCTIGISFVYNVNWTIENVKTKNHNIFEAGGTKAGIAIYASYGTLNNIWIDPPEVTDDTVATQGGYLNTSLMFNSAQCHDVFANDIFLDGGSVTTSKSAITFEDDPYRVYLDGVNVKGFVGSVIASAAPAVNTVGYYSFKNFYINNCAGVAQFTGSGVNHFNHIIFENIVAENMKEYISNGGFLAMSGDYHSLKNIYLETQNPGTTASHSMYFSNGDHVKIKDVFLSSPDRTGLYLADGCSKFEVDNVRVSGAYYHGIRIYHVGGGTQPADNKLIDCHTYNSDQAGTSQSGLKNQGARTEIAGGRFVDDQTPATQVYGIDTSGTTPNIHDNYFDGNLTKPINNTSSTPRIRNNVGYVTEASGTGSIASGTTADIITHGLNVTPTVDDISITLAENPTSTPGAIWVDTIGATYFTVKCENDPSTSNLDFGWKAIVL